MIHHPPMVEHSVEVTTFTFVPGHLVPMCIIPCMLCACVLYHVHYPIYSTHVYYAVLSMYMVSIKTRASMSLALFVHALSVQLDVIVLALRTRWLENLVTVMIVLFIF